MKRATAVLPWTIWALSALFVVFNYIQQVVPDIIAADLSTAFRAGEGTLGDIAAVYFYAYAILQIPVGLIVDHYGTRWPLIAAILLAGLGSVAFSPRWQLGQRRAGPLVMGASAAFSFIGCLKLAQEWFPPAKFSTLAGMTNTAGMLGAAAGAPVAALVKAIGWREAVAWMGWAEVALAILVLLVVRDRSQAVGDAPSADIPPLPGVPVAASGWPRDQSPNLDQCSLCDRHQPRVRGVRRSLGRELHREGLWRGRDLRRRCRVPSSSSAASRGSLFFGWWSDYLKRRKLPMVIAGMGALATMAGPALSPGTAAGGFDAAFSWSASSAAPTSFPMRSHVIFIPGSRGFRSAS